MTDVLDQPSAGGPPAAYFPAIGDTIVVGIVDVAEYHQRDYDSGEPKTWPDGGPMMGKVVTALVVSTTGSTACGGEKANAPVSAGDLVTFWCEGGKHFTYRDAVKAHGAVSVGDVMQWRRDFDKPPTNTRHNPAKQYEAAIRAPKHEDGDLVERCVAARRALKAERVDAPATPSAPAPF